MSLFTLTPGQLSLSQLRAASGVCQSSHTSASLVSSHCQPKLLVALSDHAIYSCTF